MAARKRTWTPDKVRERMRTTMLVRRLTKHVLGQVKMEQSQVTAALGLLKKVLPDLSATEFSGTVKHRDISDKPITEEEWAGRDYLETPAGAATRPN